MNSTNPRLTPKIFFSLALLFQISLLALLILIFTPFYPDMPTLGLDPSWRFGINQAAAKGLIFGREVVFTYGPYASIFTRNYHPGTDQLMICGSLYLSFSFWVALFCLSEYGRQHRITVAAMVLVLSIASPDSQFFLYPLLAGIFCTKLFKSPAICGAAKISSWTCLSVLFFPFGLLSLIKGSILFLCIAVVAISILLLCTSRRFWDSLAVVLSSLAGVSFFWVLAGQSIVNLPHFFYSNALIAQGYSEAMGTMSPSPEGTLEIVSYLLGGCGLLVPIILERTTKLTGLAHVISLFLLYLLIVFKASFVRHDNFHAIIAGASLILGTLSLTLVLKTRIQNYFLIFSLIIGFMIAAPYLSKTPFQTLSEKYRSTLMGLGYRLSDANKFRTEYLKTLDSMQLESKLPKILGSTDIYPINLSGLISSDLAWSPRPVFQSYSAYTASLATMNRDHLAGPRGPDNIFFLMEPIDLRLPALDDGPSWPVFLSNYRLIKVAEGGNSVLLQKASDSNHGLNMSPVSVGTFSFDEEIPVRARDELIFTTLKIRPTHLGRLRQLFFRPPQLDISLQMAGGEAVTYRMIPGIAESGFLISPVIFSPPEFALLYSEENLLSHQEAKSFKITSRGDPIYWEPKFDVSFNRVSRPSSISIKQSFNFQSMDKVLSKTSLQFAQECHGQIVQLNGRYPSALTTIRGIIHVRGWQTHFIIPRATLPSTVLFLKDDAGTVRIINTTPTLSPPPLLNRNMEGTGFAAMVNVSKLNGHYTLSLGFKSASSMVVCPQHHINLTIERGSWGH